MFEGNDLVENFCAIFAFVQQGVQVKYLKKSANKGKRLIKEQKKNVLSSSQRIKIYSFMFLKYAYLIKFVTKN